MVVQVVQVVQGVTTRLLSRTKVVQKMVKSSTKWRVEMKIPDNWKTLIEQNFIEYQSLSTKTTQIISNEEVNNETTDTDHTIKEKQRPANITLEQYSTITFAEYKRQRILQMRLYEISYIPMLQELRSIIDEMLQSGIVLKDDERYGFKIEPIIGEGYYTLEKWQDITNRIKGNADVLNINTKSIDKL